MINMATVLSSPRTPHALPTHSQPHPIPCRLRWFSVREASSAPGTSDASSLRWNSGEGEGRWRANGSKQAVTATVTATAMFTMKLAMKLWTAWSNQAERPAFSLVELQAACPHDRLLGNAPKRPWHLWATSGDQGQFTRVTNDYHPSRRQPVMQLSNAELCCGYDSQHLRILPTVYHRVCNWAVVKTTDGPVPSIMLERPYCYLRGFSPCSCWLYITDPVFYQLCTVIASIESFDDFFLQHTYIGHTLCTYVIYK